jgi:LmbE family N-acetylglucosaminyl deacetylase
LGEAVAGLGVNTRVLMIGAHPDDEDTFLIAWLSRGRHVETAYLSLTRGDGGQNLIGNELGEALGVIRTEELLAARRIDGARQYFTRAYDFGFSKDTVDTYRHWAKDSILSDVVRVVRAFRPHVIVAVFSGTPRDGHGHHQVSGLLAREAYDLAGDLVRFPARTHGKAWMPLKFYRSARFNAEAGTLRIDVGEYSPLLGRSFAEIAGESRSQHKSQGFGAPQRKGPVFDYLRREASRVNGATPAADERSLFDGIDTTWARMRNADRGTRRFGIDSLPKAIAAAQKAFDPMAPDRMMPSLLRVADALPNINLDGIENLDLEASLVPTRKRLNEAFRLVAGLELDALRQRELSPTARKDIVALSLYNRGRDTTHLWRTRVMQAKRDPARPPAIIVSGTVRADTMSAAIDSSAQPWWLQTPRSGAMFSQPASVISEDNLQGAVAAAHVTVGNITEPESPEHTSYMLVLTAPIEHRTVDPVKGELRRVVAGVPAISVTLDQQTQYVPANTAIDRRVNVHLRSADPQPRTVMVSLTLPDGLTADSVARTTTLAGYDAVQTLTFRLRGRLPSGDHWIGALAESNGETFSTGYQVIDYDHIRRQRLFRRAEARLSVVDVRVPAGLKVAYIPGVGDNVAPMLAQLGIPVTIVPAAELARADLAQFTTVVVGPRAYEAHPQLATANPRLLDFARRGGTLVVQYGQYEMTQPGIMPYPVTLSRPADRVTHEDAPVTIEAPDAPELRAPNRIAAGDFAAWVQERGLYMPRTFDSRYRAPLAMSDPNEPAIRGGLLIAPLESGVYVYTTLSFFRQLPAGVPGAARLFVNLLSAGLTPRVTP